MKQMTVGEVVDYYEEKLSIGMEWEHFTLQDAHCYRGDYVQIAFVFRIKPSRITDILETLRCCTGRYEGYKGGSYYLGPASLMNLAEEGETGFPVSKGMLDSFSFWGAK